MTGGAGEDQSLNSHFLERCKQFEYVRWLTCDNAGNSKSKLLTQDSNKQFYLKGGKEFCAALYCLAADSADPDNKWVIDSGYPNCILRPDESTLHPVSWTQSGRSVGQVICNSYWSTGELVSANPRSGCIKILEQLDKMGIKVLSALEYEWRVFVKHSDDNLVPLETRIEPYSGLLAHKHEKLLTDIAEALTSAGINVETLHTEFGSSQFEITMSPKEGLCAIDEGFLYREIVKEVCSNHGLVASFMSTPFLNQSANGLHYNHSLWCKKTNKNLFNNSDNGEMSQTLRHWLGGLITHSKSLTALTSPTINCYRRLHLPFTPNYCDWGLDNRETTFRVKLGSNSYVENRISSSASNPYVTASATLAAGLDGLLRGLEPPPALDRSMGSLPFTMQEALEALKQDNVLQENVGQQYCDFFIDIKEKIDIEQVEKLVNTKSSAEEKLAIEKQTYLEFY